MRMHDARNEGEEETIPWRRGEITMVWIQSVRWNLKGGTDQVISLV